MGKSIKNFQTNHILGFLDCVKQCKQSLISKFSGKIVKNQKMENRTGLEFRKMEKPTFYVGSEFVFEHQKYSISDRQETFNKNFSSHSSKFSVICLFFEKHFLFWLTINMSCPSFLKKSRTSAKSSKSSKSSYTKSLGSKMSKTSFKSGNSKGSTSFRETAGSECSSSEYCETIQSGDTSQHTISFAEPLITDIPETTLHDGCIEGNDPMGPTNVKQYCPVSVCTIPRTPPPKCWAKSCVDQCKTFTCNTGDCDGDFTPSGSKPPTLAGPLNQCYDKFAKYAPCGHWTTCKNIACSTNNCEEVCKTCPPRGKWTKKLLGQIINGVFFSSLRSLWPMDSLRPIQVHFP